MRRLTAGTLLLAALGLPLSEASSQPDDRYALSPIAAPDRVRAIGRAELAAWIRTADDRLFLMYDDEEAFVFEPVVKFGSWKQAPTGLLPHSREVRGPDRIRSVRLTRPTDRYRHGVLGDGLEAASVTVRLQDSSLAELEAGDDAVFEDLVPRLFDLDGDGQDEIIIVKSYLDRGAALAVVGLDADGELSVLAETPPIGRPNRWLNPIGAADFDGDGAVEIAYVETPHIGGRLMIWEWRDGRLVREHAEPGFSNHAIGSTELGMSAIADLDGDGLADLVIPGRHRDRLRLISLAGGELRELADLPAGGVVATAIARVGDALVFGLEDGRLIALRFPG